LSKLMPTPSVTPPQIHSASRKKSTTHYRARSVRCTGCSLIRLRRPQLSTWNFEEPPVPLPPSPRAGAGEAPPSPVLGEDGAAAEPPPPPPPPAAAPTFVYGERPPPTAWDFVEPALRLREGWLPRHFSPLEIELLKVCGNRGGAAVTF
jgi:hypothetical protein